MFRKFVGALAFALALPCSASAQLLGARVTVAGGTEGIPGGSSNTPPFIGQLGLEWRKPGARGALRLGLMHYQRNEQWGAFSSSLFPGCTAQCGSWNRLGLTGLTFDGTFDLSRGKVRPYVLSGVGTYRVNSIRGANYQCSFSGSVINSCSHGASTEDRITELSFGMHSGFGISANVRKVSLFTEFRLMMLGPGGYGYSRSMGPLTFGVKF